MSEFSHVDQEGKVNMVDVGDKITQKRTAIAEGTISLNAETRQKITDNSMKKGDVLTTARISGIQAAKQCSNLIPLCHTLLLNKVSVDTELTDSGVKVTALARCNGQTGVEMEALTAASVALLTIYDMCKAVDKNMIISHIQLVEKTKEKL
ncbi:molybdenum cofactor biosynthesis protein C [Lentisphaera araneosa HTCC2155]|uniref:cyclic pyranopterin monophosphate synthase n=1 Tax=Lentisphaera araneosa HTCC2155 TaxID=313628 RepID=A6DT47_9BACT|nr:cyclic pyranopterin monophosphate synthase MoaC [Lentisphaera araneosa]EDM25222.1 molybdenum cofactor biosynthesis protein C [Lentisphaera araneosa HTCC2155]